MGAGCSCFKIKKSVVPDDIQLLPISPVEHTNVSVIPIEDQSYAILSTSQIYQGAKNYFKTCQKKYNSKNQEIRNMGLSMLNRFFYETERYVLRDFIISVDSNGMIETLIRLIDSFFSVASETLSSHVQYPLTLSFLMLAVNYQIALISYLHYDPNQASDDLENLRQNAHLNLKNKQVLWLKSIRSLYKNILEKYTWDKSSSSWLLFAVTKVELLVISLPDVDALKKVRKAIVKIVGGVLKTALTLSFDWNLVEGIIDASMLGLKTVQRNMAWAVAEPLLEFDQIVASLNDDIRNNKLAPNFRTLLVENVMLLCTKIFPNGSTGVRWELCGGFAIMLFNIIRSLSGQAYLNILLSLNFSTSSNLVVFPQHDLSEVVDIVLQLPDDLSDKDYQSSPVMISDDVPAPFTLTFNQVITLKEMHTTCVWLWNGDSDFQFSLSELMKLGLSKGVLDPNNNIKDTLSDLVYWSEALQKALITSPKDFLFRQWMEEGFNIVFDELQDLIFFTFPTLVDNILKEIQRDILESGKDTMKPISSKNDVYLVKRKAQIGIISLLVSRIDSIQSLANDAVKSFSKGNEAIKVLISVIDKILNSCPAEVIKELNSQLINVTILKLRDFLIRCGVKDSTFITDLGSMIVLALDTVCSGIINKSGINERVDIQPELLEETLLLNAVENISRILINELEEFQKEFVGVIIDPVVKDMSQIVERKFGYIEDNVCKAFESLNEKISNTEGKLCVNELVILKQQTILDKVIIEEVNEEERKIDLALNELLVILDSQASNFEVNYIPITMLATDNIDNLSLIWVKLDDVVNVIIDKMEPLRKFYDLSLNIHHLLPLLEFNLIIVDGYQFSIHAVCSLLLNLSNKVNHCYHSLKSIIGIFLEIFTMSGLTIPPVLHLISSKLEALITEKNQRSFETKSEMIKDDVQEDINLLLKARKSVEECTSEVKYEITNHLSFLRDLINNSNNNITSKINSKLIICNIIEKANSKFKLKLKTIQHTCLNKLKIKSHSADDIIKSCFDEVNGLLEEIKEGSIKGFLETFKQPPSFIKTIKKSIFSKNKSINGLKTFNVSSIIFTLKKHLKIVADKLPTLTEQPSTIVDVIKRPIHQLQALKTSLVIMSSLADQLEEGSISMSKGLGSVKLQLGKLKKSLENNLKSFSTSKAFKNFSKKFFAQTDSIIDLGDSDDNEIRTMREELQKQTHNLWNQTQNVISNLADLGEISKSRDLYNNLELPDSLEDFFKSNGLVEKSSLTKQLEGMTEELKVRATNVFIDACNKIKSTFAPDLEMLSEEFQYLGGVELINSLCDAFSGKYKENLAKKQHYRVREIALMCAVQLIAPTSSSSFPASPLTPPPCNNILKEIISKSILEWKVFENQKFVFRALREDENSVTQTLTLNTLFHTTRVYDEEDFESDGIESQIEGMRIDTKKQLDGLNAKFESMDSKMDAKLDLMMKKIDELNTKENERATFIEHKEVLQEIITSRYDSLDEMRQQADKEISDPLRKQQIVYLCKLEIKALNEATANLNGISQKLDVEIDDLSKMPDKLEVVKVRLDIIQEEVKSQCNDMNPLESLPVLIDIFESNKKCLDKMIKNYPTKVYVESKVCLPGPNDDFKKSNENNAKPVLEACKYFLEDKIILNNFDSFSSSSSRLRNVLLLSGIARSGKTTAVEKIATYILQHHSKVRAIEGKLLVSIYVSLPTLKNPLSSIFEEGVKMYYGLTPSQTQELKEAIQKPNSNIEVIFLLDAYDELRHDAFGKNLWQTNNLEQYRPVNYTSNKLPKVIISCRSEFLSKENGRNYEEYFLPEEIKNSEKKASDHFMELRLAPFGDRREEYQRQFIALNWRDAFVEMFGRNCNSSSWRFLPKNFGDELVKVGAPKNIISLLVDLNRILNVGSETTDIDIDKDNVTKEIKKVQEILKTKMIDGNDQKVDYLEQASWIISLLAYVINVQSERLLIIFWTKCLKEDQYKLWLPKDYNDAFNSMPDLNELTTTPLMVEIVTKTLQSIKQQKLSMSEVKNNLVKMVGASIADIAWSFTSKDTTTNKRVLFQNKDNEILYMKELDVKDITNKICKRYQDLTAEKITKLPNDVPSQITKFTHIYELHDYLQYSLSHILKQPPTRRHHIYATFVDLYIAKGLKMAMNSHGNMSSDMHFECIIFTKKLAIYLTKNGISKLKKEKHSKIFRDQEKEFDYENFFSSNELIEVLRKVAPVCTSDVFLYFSHKTIQEYFVARDVVDMITVATEKCNFEKKDICGEEFLKNLETNYPWKVAATKLHKVLCDSSLAVINLHDEVGIIDFIVDFIMSDPKLVEGFSLVHKFVTVYISSGHAPNENNEGASSSASIFSSLTSKLYLLTTVLENIFTIVTKSLPNRHNQTLLHLSSGEGANNIVAFIIDNFKNNPKGDIKFSEINTKNKHIGLLLDVKDVHGKTSLMYASKGGHIEVVKLLLDEGADKEAKDDSEATALIYASQEGHINVVNLLMEKKEEEEQEDRKDEPMPQENDDTEVKCELGKTTLRSFNEVVTLVLEEGVDKEVNNKYRAAALTYASIEGHLEIVKLTLEEGVDKEFKDDYGKTALIYASQRGHIDVVKLLLDEGADKDAKCLEDKTSLMYASKKGHVEVVKLLLEEGADKETKDDDEKTALIIAIEEGHMDVVKLLLKEGADKEVKGEYGKTILIYACQRGQSEMAKLLLEEGVNKEAKDEYGKTALMYASKGSRIDVVKLLLEEGADKEATNIFGRTALIYACEKGHIEVVKLLLEEKIDKEAKDNCGMTALMYASYEAHIEVVKLLLEKGAEKEATDVFGATVLMYASKGGHIDVVRLLLDEGADKEAKCLEEKTALIYASQRGHIDVVKLLLDEGADKEVKCLKGKTALIYARKEGHRKIAKLLMEEKIDKKSTLMTEQLL